MCVICLQFQKYKDLNEFFGMIDRAYLEPNNIPKAHLADLELWASSNDPEHILKEILDSDEESK